MNQSLDALGVDACGERELAHLVLSYRRATSIQIAKKNIMLEVDRKVSEYIVLHSLLHTRQRSVKVPILNPVLCTTELGHGAVEVGGLV